MTDPEHSATPRPSRLRRAFGRIGDALQFLRSFVVNTLFLLVLVLLLGALIDQWRVVEVPENGALVLNPRGVLVEETLPPRGWQDVLISDQRNVEVEVRHLVRAVELAAQDPAIELLVLDLDELYAASPTQVRTLGTALDSFKAAGKEVIAYGNFFGQHQYYLASFANAVYMHPEGQVMLQGYGGNVLYFKDLLDKLSVTTHVFRAGEFKSAVEPMTRNDMSGQARMSLASLYGDLWQQLVQDVAANRALEPHDVQAFADNLPQIVNVTRGDFARAALESHLVDELLTADQARVRIGDRVGFDENGGEINGIGYLRYLDARGPDTDGFGQPQVGVLVVRGPIVLDSDDPAMASARDLIDRIRAARFDSRIGALVVRVDSPGGSQFASELIRQELELVQLAGKPVVASFAGVAASGGYWISATADQILAEPATITGSIGIFSFLPTYEGVLEQLGVYADGVGTGANTLGMDPFGGLSDATANLLQARVDHGYDQFLTLVARGRDKSMEDVRAVAEGREWSGAAALENGLVDALGGVDEAVAVAAGLAELETWGVQPLRRSTDPRSAVMELLLSVDNRPASPGLLDRLRQPFTLLTALDDPLDLYTLCVTCLTR